MRKLFCIAFIFGSLFLAGCEKRIEENPQNPENASSEATSEKKSQEKNEESDTSEIETKSENRQGQRPDSEKSIYSFLAQYQKYFPGKNNSTLDILHESDTPNIMFELHSNFLNLWEYWVEEKHNPDENKRDGVMKISGKMYEEHQETIKKILESSRKIDELWEDIHEEVLNTCKYQKQSVKCTP